MAPEIKAVKLGTTLILMFLFIALGSLSVFDPFRWKDKREEAKERASHVFWIKDHRLDFLTIEAKGIRVELECTIPAGCSFDNQGVWKLNKPVADAGDDSAIGALLSLLKNLEYSESVDLDAASNLAEYGLDQPAANIEFHIKGEKEKHTLKLGKSTAFGPNIYAISNDLPKKLLILQNYVLSFASQDVFHWRNKRIFAQHEPSSFSDISWDQFTFLKNHDVWLMKKPLAVNANFVMIEGLASTLSYFTAKSVYAEKHSDAVALLKKKPILHISFFAGSKAEFVDLFEYPNAQKGDHSYIASVSGRENLYLVDGTAFDRFRKNIQEYRDRNLISLAEKAMINRVSFHFPRDKQEVTLVRDAANWKYEKNEKSSEELSQTRINNFIDALAAGDVQAYPAKKDKPGIKHGIDLELVLSNDAAKFSKSFQFLLADKREALVDGELNSEYRSLGENFLKVLPVRASDLLEKNNKQVVIKENDGKYPDPPTAK